MSEGFAGDPFHEGGSQPMAGLKGGMEQPHTQQPATSEAQTNPRSAGTDNVGQSWNSTSLGASAGTTGSNDKNKPH
ncbi:hypothetical protein [Streptomyces paludis]|uniref:Uncharacterized protein n=1 Tax=Streptomyces paludis TaxID=2282738 RepID=A0A345HWT1_9ACTN|nr:hypothetical protein [Streptomyces paludis]AXG81155.1 hypothetical protein DVK44_29585 [Streptomyces paludis]